MWATLLEKVYVTQHSFESVSQIFEIKVKINVYIEISDNKIEYSGGKNVMFEVETRW